MRRQREILRGIFAMLLVAIYSIATISSSAAILFCEHPHHHHHSESHDHECECDGLRFVAECCDHHHSLLGENHTDYITTEQRHDSRSANIFTLLLQPHVATIVSESLQAPLPSDEELRYGDECEPLRAALTKHTSLRAPPVVA
ncbi:MAG: hypothetical protein J6Q36_07400 [Alistipes sp.]|nr:hypothetical protein [Alistipes sp.]